MSRALPVRWSLSGPLDVWHHSQLWHIKLNCAVHIQVPLAAVIGTRYAKTHETKLDGNIPCLPCGCRTLGVWQNAVQVFHLPQVLLDVLPGNVAFVVDEVAHIEKLVFILLGIPMALDDRAGYYADAAFFCEITVLAQVYLPLIT